MLAAARELRYRPSELARALRRQQTSTVGLLVPDINSPLATAIFHELDVLAAREGIGIVVANSGFKPEREREWLELLASKQMDVLLFWPCCDDREPMLRLLDTGQALVQIVCPVAGVPTPSFAVDFEATGRIGLRHLLEHGHDNIAVLSLNRRAMVRSLEGVHKQLAEGGSQCQLSVGVLENGPRVSDATQLALRVLGGSPRPTALLALEYNAFIGAHLAVQQLGLRVPEDVAVVAVSERKWLGYLLPPITAIMHDSHGLAVAIAALLRRRLMGERIEPEQVTFSPRLVIRRSCGCQEKWDPLTTDGTSPLDAEPGPD